MLFRNNTAKIRFLCVFLFLYIIYVPNESIANLTMAFVRDDYQKLIGYLGKDQNKEVNTLLSKWSDYVHDITKFSNSDYLEAIHRLQTDYYKEVSHYEDIIEVDTADRKKHSSAWLDDLRDHFGKEFIRKNKEAIIANIQWIIYIRNDSYYKAVSEKLIYKEAVLYGVYRNYFNMFIDYYKTLKPDDQNRLKTRKEAVDSFLSSLNDHSITRILTANSEPSQLLSAKRAEILNKELFLYFKKHSLMPNFDPMKAIADLQKLSKK